MNSAPDRRKVFRSPNIVAFLATGVVIGIIVGAIIGASGDSGSYTDWSAIGYLSVVFGALGALLGGFAAVVADWWAHR